ncbi:MAG: hypothetical protein QXQ53_08550 [Candidatus Methanosuratincola sp.]
MSVPDDPGRAADLIEILSVAHAELLTPMVEKARRVRELIKSIDPFIQNHTSIVCPLCTNVCCINRHGRYDHYDLIYLLCLGHPPPADDPAIKDEDPCRFLTPSGCILERHLRPFRCTWHFCPELITAIERGPAKAYRTFLSQFQEIQRLRLELVEDFQRTLLTDGDKLD